jgi:Tfp pilus assembly protein PilO
VHLQLSLSKLPWRAQTGAFVGVCLCAAAGFWHFFVLDAQAGLATRRTRLTAFRADAARGTAAVRRLPELEGQVAGLESRLQELQAVLPEHEDVAEILRRLQSLAGQSNLSIQRFTPQPSVQQGMYAEVPFKIQAQGTYYDLAAFFERVSRFPPIIEISNISIRAKPQQQPGATIIAEYTATTFVLQDTGPAGGTATPKVPKDPSLGK